MATLIPQPTIIPAAGNKPKEIAEYVGRVNSATEAVSIARMKSPPGWIEPGQTPEFDEYTVVLRGVLRVETHTATFDVNAGQAILARKGEWVRYSSPDPGGAEYMAVCVPAFSPTARTPGQITRAASRPSVILTPAVRDEESLPRFCLHRFRVPRVPSLHVGILTFSFLSLFSSLPPPLPSPLLAAPRFHQPSERFFRR